MTLAALPAVSLSIAFNPTNIQSLTQTWTDVSTYITDGSSNSGRQHYLDRVEPGTLSLTLNNRDGFFTNGAVNGTNATIAPRLPIKLVANYSATNYSVFYGFVESIQERLSDQLNSELTLTCADNSKMLSLRYAMSTSLWPSYVTGNNWYRCALFATNTFEANDQKGTSNGYWTNYTSSLAHPYTTVTPVFNQYGATVYDPNPSVDLSSGTNAPQNFLTLPGGNITGLDFFILGQGMNNDHVVSTTFINSLGVQQYAEFMVYGNGWQVAVTPAAGGSTTYYSVGSIITDGYWHHVGFIVSGGNLNIYCDDAVTTVTAISVSAPYCVGYTAPTLYSGSSIVTGPFNLAIGAKWIPTTGSAGYYQQSCPCFIDEVVVTTGTAVLTDFQNRYYIGLLFQRFNVSSADRISEAMIIAGWGGASGGALYNNFLYIGNSYGASTAWTPGFSTGTTTEPYFWRSPSMNMTVLDIIQQVGDTDIGAFYQRTDGNFQFNTHNYYGTWAYSEYPTTFSWTPSYTAPIGNLIWTDDASSTFNYMPNTLQITFDDADIWTSVRVTPQSGTDQMYEDTAAEPRWGYSTLLKTSTVNSSLLAARSVATFLGYLYRSPLIRAQSVELNAATGNGANLVPMLAATLGQVVHLKRTPPNAAGTWLVSQDMAVESIRHDFRADPGSWSTTFVLDPYPVRT